MNEKASQSNVPADRVKSRQLVEDCCFEENLLGDADTPVVNHIHDTATAVTCSDRFSSRSTA